MLPEERALLLPLMSSSCSPEAASDEEAGDNFGSFRSSECDELGSGECALLLLLIPPSLILPLLLLLLP